MASYFCSSKYNNLFQLLINLISLKTLTKSVHGQPRV